ncbi:hypothetical protein ACFWY9_39595 [Amycolatopsis sp. NPDC059027]|uniref:hypothetical protein n=1 Tax=Amycolatopsis sp. NPDC059027 TaxID=3346709 RepID=UPI00367034B7
MRKRPTTIICALGAVLVLTTACGQARAGTALPKGDDAAAYVGGKFETAMNKLQDVIADQRDVTTSSDNYFRFDEKYAHSVITAARTGSPESRVVHNRSQKNPDDVLDTFTPADGALEYMYLGPVFKGAAPTSWVSMPKPEGGLTMKCAFAGILTACKMADAVALSYNADKKTVKGAKVGKDGKTELTADVSFDAFLTRPVEQLPPSIKSQITPELRKAVIPTKILLNPDGSLDQMVMEAKFEGGGHKVELRYDFRFTGKASAQDLPKLPDAAQITALPDKAAKDALFDKIAEARGN